MGRASRQGSGKQKSADVEWKTVTLIYPYPLNVLQMLESPIDENDGNSTAAVKALYSSCMNTGTFNEAFHPCKGMSQHFINMLECFYSQAYRLSKEPAIVRLQSQNITDSDSSCTYLGSLGKHIRLSLFFSVAQPKETRQVQLLIKMKYP